MGAIYLYVGATHVSCIVLIFDAFLSHMQGLDATYHFSINSTHGQIYTNVSLDREAIQSYVIEVTATDMGPSPGLSRY